MTGGNFEPWLGNWIPARDSRIRLFCFPHSGGGASQYYPWRHTVPHGIDVVPVHLPGREFRLKEAPYTAVKPLVRTAAQALAPHLQPGYALFGHSYGAILAFELAREARRLSLPAPAVLCTAACRAPQLPLSHEALHQLSDQELIAAVAQRYNGIPSEILNNEELLALVTKVLRADLAAWETYQYEREIPLASPILVFGGTQDPMVCEDELDPWREQTTSLFSKLMLRGGHFFVQREPDLFVRELGSALIGAWSSATVPIIYSSHSRLRPQYARKLGNS